MKIITTEVNTENEVNKSVEIEGFDGFDFLKLIIIISASLFLIPYFIHLGWLFAEKIR